MKRVSILWPLCMLLIAVPVPSFSSPGRAVRIGYVGIASDAGLFLALEKGYFRAQGIEVSMERFGAGSDEMVLLGSGRLEIASGAPSLTLFNAIGRGLPIVVVADKGSIRKGFGFTALVVRQALVDSGRFRSLKDLKDLVLATPTPAAISLFEYDVMLKGAGMTLRDVNIEYVGVAGQPVAMANGKIDAALMTEPFASTAETHGIGKIVLSLDQLLPGLQLGLIFYNNEWAHRDPGLARRWMTAYVKALRDYNEAFRTRQGHDELITIMTRYTSIKDRAVWNRMTWPGLDPDGTVNIRSLLDYERWLLNGHQISQFILPDRLADLSYVRDADKVLGPYRP